MMNKKRFFSVLIVIFLILLALSICGTILMGMDEGQYDLGHDDVSIAVTGDVMFAVRCLLYWILVKVHSGL
jgi:poly-gamma-glutamate synthesis protein (capsule biosynthesis protein)